MLSVQSWELEMKENKKKPWFLNLIYVIYNSCFFSLTPMQQHCGYIIYFPQKCFCVGFVALLWSTGPKVAVLDP